MTTLEQCQQGDCSGFGPPTGPSSGSYIYTDISQSPPAQYAARNGGWVLLGARGQYGSLITFGDSLTQGTGSTTFTTPGPNATAYAYGLLNDFASPGTNNHGTGGDMTPDMAYKIQTVLGAVPLSGNPAVTMLIGTNDANVYGASPDGQMISRQALTSAIVWATTPDVNKFYFANANVATWSVTPLSDGAKKYTTTNGATVTLTVTTTSGILYLITQQADNLVGTTSVLIDGVAPANDSVLPHTGYNGHTIMTANGFPVNFPVFRYVVKPGTHTITLTNNNPGNSSVGQMEPVCVATADALPSTLQTPPVAYVGTQAPTRGTQTAAITSAYDKLIRAVVAQLAADGLNVQLVDLSNFLNGTTDYDGLTLPNGTVVPPANYQPYHPNDLGHFHIRQAFESVMRPANRSTPFTVTATAPDAGNSAGYSGWVFSMDGHLALCTSGSCVQKF